MGKRTWTKGMKSPNPGGRPRTLGIFREQCREAAPTALATLEAAMKEGGAVAVAAARVLLAYAYGQPPAAQEDREAAHGNSLAGLSTTQILAIARGEPPELEPGQDLADAVSHP